YLVLPCGYEGSGSGMLPEMIDLRGPQHPTSISLSTTRPGLAASVAAVVQSGQCQGRRTMQTQGATKTTAGDIWGRLIQPSSGTFPQAAAREILALGFTDDDKARM